MYALQGSREELYKKVWAASRGEFEGDLYDMVKDNVAFRKQKAAEYGIDFELPNSVSIVPNAPKNTAKKKIKKAA